MTKQEVGERRATGCTARKQQKPPAACSGFTALCATSVGVSPHTGVIALSLEFAWRTFLIVWHTQWTWKRDLRRQRSSRCESQRSSWACNKGASSLHFAVTLCSIYFLSILGRRLLLHMHALLYGGAGSAQATGSMLPRSCTLPCSHAAALAVACTPPTR